MPTEKKRMYNATYRLRDRIGAQTFPKRGKIIYSPVPAELETFPETKILLQEFGFIIQSELFKP